MILWGLFFKSGSGVRTPILKVSESGVVVLRKISKLQCFGFADTITVSILKKISNLAISLFVISSLLGGGGSTKLIKDPCRFFAKISCNCQLKCFNFSVLIGNAVSLAVRRK